MPAPSRTGIAALPHGELRPARCVLGRGCRSPIGFRPRAHLRFAARTGFVVIPQGRRAQLPPPGRGEGSLRGSRGRCRCRTRTLRSPVRRCRIGSVRLLGRRLASAVLPIRSNVLGTLTVGPPGRRGNGSRSGGGTGTVGSTATVGVGSASGGRSSRTGSGTIRDAARFRFDRSGFQPTPRRLRRVVGDAVPSTGGRSRCIPAQPQPRTALGGGRRVTARSGLPTDRAALALALGHAPIRRLVPRRLVRCRRLRRFQCHGYVSTGRRMPLVRVHRVGRRGHVAGGSLSFTRARSRGTDIGRRPGALPCDWACRVTVRCRIDAGELGAVRVERSELLGLRGGLIDTQGRIHCRVSRLGLAGGALRQQGTPNARQA